MLVGRALTLAEQGPVRYSGFELFHPSAHACRVEERASRAMASWYWVPEGKRDQWRGRSIVGDIQDHERARLASGELEEERNNVTFWKGLPVSVLAEWLNLRWKVKCIQRLGCLPEQFQRASAIDLTPGASRLEQERTRIVIG